MKAGEKDRLGVIRLMNAAIKQREVDERIELDDAAVLAVLEKMVAAPRLGGPAKPPGARTCRGGAPRSR